MQEGQEDKENCGPSPDRHRSSSLPPEAKNPARVLADISCTSARLMYVYCLREKRAGI
jgi:hypothetical protein